MGRRWAAVGWVWASTACFRVVTPDNVPPDGGEASRDAAPPLVLVDSLQVEAPRADAGALTVVGYGGDVLRVVARGFGAEAQPRVLLGSIPLLPATGDGGAVDTDAGLLDLDGGPLPVTLRVVLPEQKVSGSVEVVAGERTGRSTQVVAVVGRGHPEDPRMSGTLETQMAIRAAGVGAIPCGPPMIPQGVDGGRGPIACATTSLDPGTVGVAFSFGPTLIYQEPTYLAQLTFYGTVEKVVALNPDPARGISGVIAFSTDVGTVDFLTQEVVSQSAGYLGRQVFAPGDGGIPTRVVEPAVTVGLRESQTDFVMLALGQDDAGPGVRVTRNGGPLYPDGTTPWLPGVPAAAGLVAQGYDPVGDFFGTSTVLTARCGGDASGRHVLVDRLLADRGLVTTSRGAMPEPDLTDPMQPVYGCDALPLPLRASCEALATCPDCERMPACAGDPECRDKLQRLHTCLAAPSCAVNLLAWASCVAHPACAEALLPAFFPHDGGVPPCNGDCAAAQACSGDVDCLPAIGCLFDTLCTPPPSCGSGGACEEKTHCALDEHCTAQAQCQATHSCEDVEACYQHLCRGDVDDPDDPDSPRQMLPLLPGLMLLQEQPSPIPFHWDVQPICALNLYSNTVQPILPRNFQVGTYAAVTDRSNDHAHVLVVPPLGSQMLVFDLNTGTLESSPTRVPYRQLVADSDSPLVYAVPENGGRMDILNASGAFSGSVHVLGPPLAAFPLPADDGRLLIIHPNFVLLTDGAGIVKKQLFIRFTGGVLDSPNEPNGPPPGAWVLSPPETSGGLGRLAHLELDLREGYDLKQPTDSRPAPAGVERGSLVAAYAGAGGGTQLLVQLEDIEVPNAVPRCPTGSGGFGSVPYLAVLDTTADAGTEPVFVDGTCNQRAAAFHPGKNQVLLFSNDDNSTHRLDLLPTPALPPPAPTDPYLPPSLGTVPHPNGSFVGLFVNVSADMSLHLELGQVYGPPGHADYHAVAQVDFSEWVLALSPDGERLYVGRSGSILELELSADPAQPADWLKARVLRSIVIDGRADVLQMDSQGTRLLYTDYEHQVLGVVE